jgi:transmembrane sensor
MKRPPKKEADLDGIEHEAAAWILRRDRGLTAAEQDEFSQWLATDPKHGACFARHRRDWDRLDQLAEWQPRHSPRPNPDLLAPPSKRLHWMLPLTLASAAAALIVFVYVPWPRTAVAPNTAFPAVSFALIEERLLEDGSKIKLNRGAVVTANFTPGERLVRLERGEANFEVAKNPKWPFIVDAGRVRVRAVGTAFDVRLGEAAIAVLVTEGRVQINAPGVLANPDDPSRDSALSATTETTPIVEAGQRAVVSLAPAGGPPRVVQVSVDDVERLLAWQPRLLDFTTTPLSEILAEFNRHNPVQLSLADPDLATLRISASFRSDNIEGFVRLLGSSFGVRAERRGVNEIVLLKSE